MPPRRSCFGRSASGSRAQHPGFNATTAFLLHWSFSHCGHDHLWFQCHHGVPASSRRPPMARGAAPVSMPPRRSCFPIIPRDRGLLSSLGGDVERDGDRWVRTSVGFDGHFTLSSLSHHRGSAEALSDPPLIRTFYIPKRRSSLHRMDRRSRVPSPCYASLDDPSADPRSPDFPWGSADDF